MKNWVIGAGAAAGLALLAAAIWLWTPSRAFDRDAALEAAKAYDARIIRDAFGVPHIYGSRNSDVAFGLAYAHAEDDWATLEEVLRFARGELAAVTGKDGAITDYLVDVLRVGPSIAAQYEKAISPETKAILGGYAAGINLWCAEARGRCGPNVAPVTAQDIVAGFTSRTPFFFGLDDELTALFEGSPEGEAGEAAREAFLNLPAEGELGSNAVAVSPVRSADGATRLLVNSHQPFTGPVAWYEARVKSDEGWDMIGGIFPGAPVILLGTGPDLGWAFTVNRPDLVDIYRLEVDNEKKPTRYRFGDDWKPLARETAKFRVKLFGPFSLPVTRPVYRSVHGPVFKTPGGYYAAAFAGDGDIRSVEQWRRMNFARDYSEWRAAMEMTAIPSFNVVYGDRTGRIAYFHNAALPIRAGDYDGQGVADGSDPALVWQGFRAFDENPKVIDPASGYVGNANNNPFEASGEGDSPRRADFPAHYGVDNRSTNRGLMLQTLYGADPSITEEEFIQYKMDDAYAPDSRLVRLVEGLGQNPDATGDPSLAAALDVLRTWDRTASVGSRGAALAILTGQKMLGYTLGGPGPGPTTTDPVAALRETVAALEAGFGRIDPEWGDVNRMRRGDVDMPVDGGPDTLRAIYSLGEPSAGPLTASFGDTHIMLVEWKPDGAQRIRTILPFGAAALDEASPHYNDQAPLFVRKEWREPAMALEALLEEATADGRVGGGGGRGE